MKKTILFPIVATFLFFGCAKTVPLEQYDSKTKEVEALSAQSKKLSSDVEVLKQDKVNLEKEKETLQAEIKELSQKAEKAEQLEKATQTYQDLTKKLEKEIQEGQVQITEMKNRLTMTMVDKIIFPSGSAMISAEGKQVLDKVVSILKDVKDKRIQIEGHTDNVQIVSALKKRFPTNWELSTARATQVVRYLQDKGGIDPVFLSATGFSEYQPVASNDTEEGKRKNRRIEIVLLPLTK
ncbi:MAG: OmpA family protein [Nitrospirota bacterium]